MNKPRPIPRPSESYDDNVSKENCPREAGLLQKTAELLDHICSAELMTERIRQGLFGDLKPCGKQILDDPRALELGIRNACARMASLRGDLEFLAIRIDQ